MPVETASKTIDMADKVDSLHEDLATIKTELERVQDEADAADTLDEYEALEDEYDDLQDLAEEIDAEIAEWRDLVDEKREEWDGTEFTITEFHWGHRNQIDDLVRKDASAKETDDRAELIGSVKARTVQVGVTSTPPDAPTKPSDYPPKVGDWLYNEVSAFNERGETNFTRSSLRDSVAPPDDSQPN